MYDIKIFYRTGNSFGSEDAIDNLDLPVESLDIAKENLQRIKTHTEVMRKLDNSYREIDKPVIPDFYIVDTRGIILKIDNERTHQIDYPFWTGYFESIQRAEIIAIGDDAMAVDF